MEKPAGTEQRDAYPDEWAEAEARDEDDYVILSGGLYLLQRPHLKAASYPQLLLPSSQVQKVIEEVHEGLGHYSWLTTLRFI